MQTKTNSNPENKDFRVLVFTPTGRDGALICQLLDRVGIPCVRCNSWDGFFTEIHAGAGTLILGEEALTQSSIEKLSDLINRQPPWSDFPLLLLTAAGAVNTSNLRRHEIRQPLGNVLLLERPIRPETLVSTIQSALRARRRQYQIRDQIRQQQQAEEALRKSEKLAIAGRMAASIAHEINNPLEAVTNLIYLSLTSERMSDIKEYLVTAQQEMARVSAIATHTLKFYRDVAAPAPVNVTDILDSVLVLFHPRLTNANIIVEKDFKQVGPIQGFAGELRQLFANLIGNALDAMRAGGTLMLRAHGSTDLSNGSRPGIRVVIADTGAGIAPEMKSKIFEPFVTTKAHTGTGLGLWISSEIIRKHSGRVRLKSWARPHKSGTVFSIFLPAMPSADKPGQTRLKSS